MNVAQAGFRARESTQCALTRARPRAGQLLSIARAAALAAVVALLTAGCASSGHKSGKPVAWNVKVTKSTAASVEVDLLGISPSEDSYWRRSVKPDDYWNPNKPIRKQAQNRSRTTRFESGPVFVLKMDDPIWKQWRSYGTTELLVMANLPGKYSNDEADPRRLIVPIGKNDWQAKDNTLELEILDGQIRVLTPAKP
jgi:hypothetical protein